MAGSALLLTGPPGVGKTSLIKAALARSGVKAGGFYTEEIREGGVRRGFRIVTLSGEEATFAHGRIASPFRVGKYGVDITILESVGVVALSKAIRAKTLVVVDEIGRMELFSVAFQKAVLAALEGKLLGTIMQAPHPFADRLKALPDVRVVTLSRGNRSEVETRLVQWLELVPKCHSESRFIGTKNLGGGTCFGRSDSSGLPQLDKGVSG